MDEVPLQEGVLRNPSMVSSCLRNFDIMLARCPHDIMADYMVRESVDQWNYVASKCHVIACSCDCVL